MKQTPALAVKACRKLGTQGMAFLRRGQLVRAPLLNDLSCLMDGLALITNCLWHYLQFTKLLAAFHLPSVVNHLPVVQGEQQERGWTAGPGDQVFEKQGYAGDARGSRCRWAGLLFSHTCKPELWDYPFFVSPLSFTQEEHFRS